MSNEWDGKVVMSTPGGPIVEMSLGDLLARKDAEIERLRENVDRAGKEVERADRLRAEIARVKADERKNRAEIVKLRAENERLREDRRERIATAALQGLLSKWVGPPQQGADLAIQYADALIAELDKEEGKP